MIFPPGNQLVAIPSTNWAKGTSANSLASSSASQSTRLLASLTSLSPVVTGGRMLPAEVRSVFGENMGLSEKQEELSPLSGGLKATDQFFASPDWAILCFLRPILLVRHRQGMRHGMNLRLWAPKGKHQLWFRRVIPVRNSLPMNAPASYFLPSFAYLSQTGSLLFLSWFGGPGYLSSEVVQGILRRWDV